MQKLLPNTDEIIEKHIIAAEDPKIATSSDIFTALYCSTRCESIAWIVSTTKKCIWQANPLVREGTKFMYVSILKVIDLDTFGLLGGSNAFEAISGPAGQRRLFGPPNGSKASSRPLSSEIMKNITNMDEYGHL